MDKLLLELILNDIIKDDTLKFDKGSGLYYVNNRVNNSFLIDSGWNTHEEGGSKYFIVTILDDKIKC